ncbi:hypothetical protein EDB81DRAFT_56366 [Dactylonectria macrodidyma]|uniref:Secreted protein n=1 Tax=Dactylonectria macrodidyma TaxID=307937 RepID=A0A9P9EN78_9HYPO|nr:hypothetical protein EDB81DRAFT_56366 [Dactylonectria macrodidyma]
MHFGSLCFAGLTPPLAALFVMSTNLAGHAHAPSCRSCCVAYPGESRWTAHRAIKPSSLNSISRATCIRPSLLAGWCPSTSYRYLDYNCPLGVDYIRLRLRLVGLTCTAFADCTVEVRKYGTPRPPAGDCGSPNRQSRGCFDGRGTGWAKTYYVPVLLWSWMSFVCQSQGSLKFWVLLGPFVAGG